jgi:hypothetical protein
MELRYADGPTTEVELSIAARVEELWDLVSDINLPARFGSEFQGGRWLDGADAAALGARFTGRNKHAAIGEWETVSTITEFVPLALFGWVVGDVAEPSAQWRFTLRSNGAETVVSQWMRLGPGRSGLSPAIDAMPDKEDRIIRRRLEEHRRNMQANLDGISVALTERK